MKESAKQAQVVPPVVPERGGIKKPRQPWQCRGYMRKVLVNEFPGIVEGFVKQATSGSCHHVKLATELLEPKRRAAKPRRKRNSLDQWIEQMQQEG